ncbi:putative IclR family transcriptional regulator [Gordonia hirsuta DSM 44140 = NBRC 16056]|uniref:Putative IclR family transcriptional regulator n=1 Tax=Gordonia hirsuta DSM 44140 = NBRC 16056 TaxID=1121927 RepID=L7L8I9_9ACTN|nr:IclR family transcriptional regulator [Gordonia hirsuta]GAC57244.1 putative IclR family transcriptional regulator [Gordonia hirsuta DSM 44140 = NBRC 16056]
MGNSSGIGVLDKSVLVLQTVAQAPCNLAELTEATGLPRATAHRLAAGLQTHRLLTRDGDGRWIPGPELHRLAGTARDAVVEAAAPLLPRLQQTTGESVQLYRLQGSERVCIAAVEPPTGLRNTVPVGSRLPMTAGSAARVLAAFGDRATQEEAGFSDRALAEVRRRGWAQSTGERADGVASVSAPVHDGTGRIVAAVSVSGPIDRMGRRPGERWADDLLAIAAEIGARL